MNAVLRHLGIVEGTVHCKDREPQECSQILVRKIRSEFGNPKVLLVGFQPRMAEALAKNFSLRITDLDENNIGREKFGVMVQDPVHTQENLGWCNLVVVSGSTIVNDTMKKFLNNKPTLFYGVSVAGATYLLGLNRFCPFGN